MNIKRLAEHLNISIGTVSRALNGKPGVHPDTRARTLQAAAALGYVPNQSGRNLRRGATNTIGFVVETGATTSLSGDSFFYTVIDAMSAALLRRGYDLVVLACHSADDPLGFLSRVAARGMVDALVITATRRHDPRISLLGELNLPYVTLGRSETQGDHAWLDLDFAGAAQAAVTTLVNLGHRRIAVALPDTAAMFGCYIAMGYRQALALAGIVAQDDHMLPTRSSEAGGYALGQRIMSMADRPSALLLSSEATTVGLLGSLSEHGVRAGRDISVVSLRETSQMRFLTPTLASFRLSLSDLGTRLADLVLDDLAAGRPATGARQQILWPLDYVAGGSVAAPGG